MHEIEPSLDSFESEFDLDAAAVDVGVGFRARWQSP